MNIARFIGATVASLVLLVLLTALFAAARLAGSSLAAAGIGAMAGLLAALPSTLHTNAMAHVPVSGEVAAVLWTTISWALAARVAHRAYSWHRAA